MKGTKFLSYWGGIVILLISGGYLTPMAYAQLALTTATLTGTVTDSSGAVVPQATVTLTSPEIGIARSYTTSALGYFSFSQLPPSTYQLLIRARGFANYVQKGISLDAGQSAGQNITLTVGSATQEVVVTSEAPLLNTTNANISAEVDNKQLVELPLNERNIYGLIGLNSSVNNNSEFQIMLGGGGNTTDDADQDITFLNFGGGFFGTSAYLLDGTWDTNPQSWGAVVYVPSVDDTQEFKIQNNSFTAQYGWSTGNVVDVTTKSGTQTFHGDAYEFYRNGAMDANLWFSDHNGLPKQSLTRNQVGISEGGPLEIPGLYKQRDKTYFFGLFEHLGLNSPSAGVFTIPDTNMRAGNFLELLGSQVGTDALGRPILSGQIYDPRSGRAITAGVLDPKTGLVANATGFIRDPIPGNNVAAFASSTIPGGTFDPVGAKLLSYYPTPTNSALVNNLTVPGNAPAASNEYTMRLDQNLDEASRFYARYSYKSEHKTGEPSWYGASNPASPGVVIGDSRWDVVAGYSHVFSQNFTMNVHTGVESWHEDDTVSSLGFQPSTLGLPSYLDINSQFPEINIGSDAGLGHAGNALYAHGPIVSTAVEFTKLAGAHTISLGFMGFDLVTGNRSLYSNEINILGSFTCGPNPYSCTANTGNGVAQTLLGLPDSGSTGISFNPSTAQHFYGWYLQDDWRALTKLTLNLGVRYDIQGAPTVHHNAASVFNPDAINPIGTEMGVPLFGALQFLSPGNRGVYNTAYSNFAPRIGFSYQAIPKLIFRGGYGIFYPVFVTGGGSTDGYGASTPIVSSVNAGLTPATGFSLDNPWPNGYVAPSGSSLGELQDVGFSTGSVFRNHATSYIQQYMFGLQYAISQNNSLEVDYVGNRGTHIATGSLNRSQLDPTYLSQGASALNSLVTNPYQPYIAAIGKGSGCGLDQATIVKSQLLQPYPQYCGVSEGDAAVGFSSYNALQATYNHRFHDGLSVLVSYTFSKFLDNVEGAQGWSIIGSPSPANNYDMAAEKSVDGNDTPQSLVVSYIYNLPIGKGRAIGSGFNRKIDAVLGGWEVSGIVTDKAGIPDAVSGSNWNSYGGTPRPDVIGNTHAPHQSIQEWFNTGAFAYAPYGSFGTAPRYFSNIRSPDYNNIDTGIMKNWYLRESMRIQFRAEMFNTFNHPQFYSPNGSYRGCDPNTNSSCPSGFGQITNAFPARQVQMSGKFYW
jgi:Carboxypeptidase regulatory-like domain